MALIAGRREIGNALRGDLINRLRDHAILKKWLIRVTDVIVNDFGAGRCQADYSVRKIRLAVHSRIKGQGRVGRHHVNDLQDRTSFVSEWQLFRSAVIQAWRLLEDTDTGGQCAGTLVG